MKTKNNLTSNEKMSSENKNNQQKSKNIMEKEFNINNSKKEKKLCKCPELLCKKYKRNFEDDIPYHIKKKFTSNALLNDGNDEIVLFSKSEFYNENNNTKQIKEEKIKSANASTTKTKSKNELQNNGVLNSCMNLEEADDPKMIKDILIEISEISADLELFEMERRKRRMMKLIELMADQLDNNITNPNELTDLFFFNKKME